MAQRLGVQGTMGSMLWCHDALMPLCACALALALDLLRCAQSLASLGVSRP